MNDNDISPRADHERGPRATVAPAIRYAGRAAASAAGAERATMRASDTDRDRAAELLNVAYSEGRLSKDEYDGRLERAFSARTYADLDQIVADLPAAGATVVTAETSVARTNGLAIASLACGIAQFAVGPLATIPAIVLGHMARSQIRRTGEEGAGLALAGLILGWGAVILAIIVLVIGLAVAAGMSGGGMMH